MTAALLIALLTLVVVFAVVVLVRRARQLVAGGKIVLAAKAIRDETGWELARVRDVVDAIRAEQPRRRDDGHFGGF